MTSTHSLNLLPPEDQKRIGYKRLILFFTYIHAGTFIILIIGNTLLLPTYFFLFFQNRGTNELLAAQQQTMETKEDREIESRIQQANTTLAYLKTTYAFTQDSLVASVTDTIVKAPPGITFMFLSFEKETSKMTLRGHAPARNDLLQFITALRAHPSFHDIESPVENILRDKNISFTLSFTVGNEKKP
ncbi:MAG: hypothetical protein A3J54_00795 [Candidatus Ryanbacteria bacterium RIFCSPHIGHO2_02_FULL_45_13b]|uniref:Fimbrial assembly protein n=1 Tax=Candidatus Ryanbacteria bacterium RIFCSPHIGHO2_02_FULL_45_13b TaxID=1802117 RepID=A0A1G2G5R0_9BACT|nr:MAG: hypothetical protein A3J54_00795 [Candidatus Ryanbacteria bacterium RIFCSPHIGHO2_02_FULL_45_13b]